MEQIDRDWAMESRKDIVLGCFFLMVGDNKTNFSDGEIPVA